MYLFYILYEFIKFSNLETIILLKFCNLCRRRTQFTVHSFNGIKCKKIYKTIVLKTKVC